jgi:hypothetical protein
MIEDPSGALADDCDDLSFNRFTYDSYTGEKGGPVIIYSARADDAECAADFFAMDGLPDAASVLAGDFGALDEAGLDGQVRGFFPFAKVERPDGEPLKVKYGEIFAFRADKGNVEALEEFAEAKAASGADIDDHSVFSASLPFGPEGIDLLFLGVYDKSSPLLFSTDDFASAIESRWKVEFERSGDGASRPCRLRTSIARLSG